MVRREPVADERGRRWIAGSLPAEEYFRVMRAEARERARAVVLARLNGDGRPAGTFGH